MKKRISVLACTILMCAASYAQTNYDTPLRVVVDNENLSADTDKYLYDRLQNLISGTGMGTKDVAARFYVTPVFSERSKTIVGSAPAQYVVEADITLYVADILNGKVYSRFETLLKGVGRSEELAYRNAITSLNKQRGKLDSFISSARAEIVSYFISEGDNILKSAKTAAAMHDYAQALFILSSIPSSCNELYDSAQEQIVSIYGQYVDYEGTRLLNEAKTVWAASQNRDGALEAMAIINRIAPEASCRADADKFISEVGARIGEEWNLEKTLVLGEQELEKQRIEAGRQVGIAYGNNQKPTTVVLDR